MPGRKPAVEHRSRQRVVGGVVGEVYVEGAMRGGGGDFFFKCMIMIPTCCGRTNECFVMLSSDCALSQFLHAIFA